MLHRRFLSWSKRYQPPVVKLTSLPAVDYIVISHDHYDHLDKGTIEHFIATRTHFFVPLGVGAHLRYWGVQPARITELDWWDERSIDGLRFVAAPAQHWSGRMPVVVTVPCGHRGLLSVVPSASTSAAIQATTNISKKSVMLGGLSMLPISIAVNTTNAGLVHTYCHATSSKLSTICVLNSIFLFTGPCSTFRCIRGRNRRKDSIKRQRQGGSNLSHPNSVS